MKSSISKRLTINQLTLIFLILTPLTLLSAFSGVRAADSKTALQEVGNELTDANQLIPLEDFFKNPVKAGFEISDDGKYVSYLAPYESRLNVFVERLDDGRITRLTSETKRDILKYLWKGNNRILFLKDSNGDENYKLFGVDIDGSNLRAYTNFDNVRTDIIDDLRDDPLHIIIGINQRNPQIFDAYRLNILTGQMKLVAINPGNIVSWMTDHKGQLRLATTSDGSNTSLLYRDDEKSEFKPVLTVNFKDTLQPLFFTFDNNNIYAVSNLGRDKAALIQFDLKKKKESKLIYENPRYDLSSVSYSKKRKVLLMASYISWKAEHHFFDEMIKNVSDKVQKRLPNTEIFINDMDKGEDKFIVRSYSDKTRGAYYLYNLATDELTLLQEVSPWLKPSEMADQKPIEYTARDGLKIHGYLTLPKGSSGKNIPIIVNPHGGPWARDSWGFNPEIQFLASRGWGVFQMNFRGSTGYGKKFWEASFKEWGRKMQDDITDGVYWLIREEVADKNKVAIYGASYGGYATLAGLTFTPDLYACGVDYCGVSNLLTFMNTIPPYWKPVLAQLYEEIGNPQDGTGRELLESASPIFHADRIRVPLFIAQGAHDPRVNKNESDQMVDALRKRGIDVEYMVKENEGHGFHNEENRFDFYRAMEQFLRKNLR